MRRPYRAREFWGRKPRAVALGWYVAVPLGFSEGGTFIRRWGFLVPSGMNLVNDIVLKGALY